MKRHLLLILICIANTTSLWASSTWITGIRTGLTYYKNPSNTDYISPGQYWPNDRYTQSNINNTTLFSLFAGKQWSRDKSFIPYYSIVLNYTDLNPTQVHGQLDQYSLIQFRNYRYSYNIQTQALFLNFKANLIQWNKCLPFIKLGLGASYNRASGFQETAYSNVTPRITPVYSSDTSVYLATSLELGLDYILTKNTWINLGYEFADYGMANINYIHGGSLSTPLRTNNINIGILFNYA